MIGAVNEIEMVFGYLWGHGEPEDKLTENQKKFLKLWQRLRSKILNNGNDQIRSLDDLLRKFQVNCYQYSYQMPVKRRTNVS